MPQRITRFVRTTAVGGVAYTSISTFISSESRDLTRMVGVYVTGVVGTFVARAVYTVYRAGTSVGTVGFLQSATDPSSNTYFRLQDGQSVASGILGAGAVARVSGGLQSGDIIANALPPANGGTATIYATVQNISASPYYYSDGEIAECIVQNLYVEATGVSIALAFWTSPACYISISVDARLAANATPAPTRFLFLSAGSPIMITLATPCVRFNGLTIETTAASTTCYAVRGTANMTGAQLWFENCLFSRSGNMVGANVTAAVDLANVGANAIVAFRNCGSVGFTNMCSVSGLGDGATFAAYGCTGFPMNTTVYGMTATGAAANTAANIFVRNCLMQNMPTGVLDTTNIATSGNTLVCDHNISTTTNTTGAVLGGITVATAKFADLGNRDFNLALNGVNTFGASDTAAVGAGMQLVSPDGATVYDTNFVNIFATLYGEGRTALDLVTDIHGSVRGINANGTSKGAWDCGVNEQPQIVKYTVRPSGGDYASTVLAVRAFAANYPDFRTNNIVGVVEAGGGLQDASSISTATMTGSYNNPLIITTASSDKANGVWDATKFTIKGTVQASFLMPYLQWRNVQFDNAPSGTTGYTFSPVTIGVGSVAPCDQRFDRCFFKGSGAVVANTRWYANSTGGLQDIRVTNCVFWNMQAATNTVTWSFSNGNKNATLAHCTFVSCAAPWLTAITIFNRVFNNLIIDAAVTPIAAYSNGSSGNVTNFGSGTGSTTVFTSVNATAAAIFKDPTNGDFRLLATDTVAAKKGTADVAAQYVSSSFNLAQIHHDASGALRSWPHDCGALNQIGYQVVAMDVVDQYPPWSSSSVQFIANPASSFYNNELSPSGNTWTNGRLNNGGSFQFTYASNGTIRYAGGLNQATTVFSNTALPSFDYEVGLDVVFLSAGTSLGVEKHFVGALARYDDVANNGYWLRYEQNYVSGVSNSQWALYRLDAGVVTLLGSYTLPTEIAVNKISRGTIKVQGNQISATIDSGTVGSGTIGPITDSTYTGSGTNTFGFRYASGGTITSALATGLKLDNVFCVYYPSSAATTYTQSLLAQIGVKTVNPKVFAATVGLKKTSSVTTVATLGTKRTLARTVAASIGALRAGAKSTNVTLGVKAKTTKSLLAQIYTLRIGTLTKALSATIGTKWTKSLTVGATIGKATRITKATSATVGVKIVGHTMTTVAQVLTRRVGSVLISTSANIGVKRKSLLTLAASIGSARRLTKAVSATIGVKARGTKSVTTTVGVRKLGRAVTVNVQILAGGVIQVPQLNAAVTLAPVGLTLSNATLTVP